MKRIHTIVLGDSVAPAGSSNCIFDLSIPNRTAKVRSIYFDIRMANHNSPYDFLNRYTQTSQNMSLDLYAPTSNFAEAFSPQTNPGIVISTGIEFLITAGSQMFFDSFFVRNSLRFSWSYSNNDASKTVDYRMSLVTEIEILDE